MYFLGCIFKSNHELFDGFSKNFIGEAGNNYLKMLFPFLPKKPEHWWGLKIEFIEEIKEKIGN